MGKKYRVGVIGRTEKGNYGHHIDTVWLKVPQTEVVAVADEHKGGREAAVQRIGAQRGYADFREMLAKEKLDIVAICPRWVDQHHAMLMACAEHACHVYMEKPFVRDLQEADEVVRAMEMRHLKLGIATTNRYSPVHQLVKKLVEDGEIGDVLEVRSRGKEDSRRGGGEDLWVLGTHKLDLLRYFVGDIATCYAIATEKGRPITKHDVYDGAEGIGPLAADEIDAMYTFKDSRIVGYFSSHRGVEGIPARFGLAICGSKGVLLTRSGYLSRAHILKDPSWGRTASKWIPITSAGIGQPEPRKNELRNYGHTDAILDLLQAIEQDRQPLAGLYDARATIEMIAAIFDSQRLGGPVTFPLKNRRNPLTML